MASTYSNLKIQLMTTGENSGTWGNVTNTNLGTAIEEAITGSVDVTFASGDVTLTLTNTNATQSARNLRLNCTGTTGGARNLILGSGCQIEKVYIVNNGCADAITIKNTTGTGIAVPAGKTMYVFNNGTNVVDAITHLTSLTLASALPVASGGTGLTSPGTSGNVLVSNGSAWTSGSGFPSGGIIMWSGTIATIPSGWYLCDGNNGTPDLRNKFIIAADADSGGAAKTTVTGSATQSGGTKDAIVVSHDHTYSGTTSTAGAHQHTGALTQSTKSGTGPTAVVSSVESLVGNYNYTTNSAGDHSHTFSGTTASSGSSGTNQNLPPYFALAYIMKA